MLEAFRGSVLLGIEGTILFSLYYLLTIFANLNNSTSAFPMVIILSFIGFATIGLGLALILQTGKSNKING